MAKVKYYAKEKMRWVTIVQRFLLLQVVLFVYVSFIYCFFPKDGMSKSFHDYCNLMILWGCNNHVLPVQHVCNILSVLLQRQRRARPYSSVTQKYGYFISRNSYIPDCTCSVRPCGRGEQWRSKLPELCHRCQGGEVQDGVWIARRCLCHRLDTNIGRCWQLALKQSSYPQGIFFNSSLFFIRPNVINLQLLYFQFVIFLKRAFQT